MQVTAAKQHATPVPSMADLSGWLEKLAWLVVMTSAKGGKPGAGTGRVVSYERQDLCYLSIGHGAYLATAYIMSLARRKTQDASR